MASPSYSTNGVGSNVAGDISPTPAWPTNPFPGAIAIMQASVRGSSIRTVTAPSGWGLIVDSGLFSGTLTMRNYIFVYGTTVSPTPLTSTESGTVTVPFSTDSTAGRNAAIIHMFTGKSGIWHFESIGSSHSTATLTTFNDADVTASTNDRLAVNLVTFPNNQGSGSTGFLAPTNMTGGTWAITCDFIDNNPSMHVLTAELSSSGTVGGGTSVMPVGSAYSNVGFAIYADAVNHVGPLETSVFYSPIFRAGTVR